MKIKNKAKKIVEKTIIIFITALILLNSVITMPVFAAIKNISEGYKTKIEEIKKAVDDENVKSQLNNDGELAEFIYLYETTKGHIVSKKKDKYTELAQLYVDRYKPFKEKNPSDFDGDMVRMWQIGFTGEFTKYMDEITEKYNDYLKEIGVEEEEEEMRTKQEVQDIESAENQRIIQLLRKTRDNGTFIVGPVFEAVCKLVIAIGDAVMNIMQKMMLPGSPTAVKQRYYEIKDILDARGSEDYYYIFFYEVQYEKDMFKDSDRPLDIPWSYAASTDPVPFIYYTPLAIFSNKLPAFDVNFINENEQLKNPFVENVGAQMSFLERTEFVNEKADYVFSRETNDVTDAQNRLQEAADDANGENKANPAKTIQKVVAKWYVALRNITATGLLIVLVYIGIRILIAVTGEEEAKYKTMLKDWVMGVVLLFFLHFIMSALLAITNAMSGIAVNKINFLDTTTGGDSLFNELRTQIVLYSKREDLVMMGGYTMLYVTTIWYTIRFTWKFLKRVIFMAFLTVIAPLVALTYPLDKIRDGKSQAFDLWLKEYTFNLILQPIDLLVYIVIFSSAMELVQANPLYGVVAIGFVAQAENIIKKMFGLEPRMDSGNGAFASGAVFGSIMSGLQTGARGLTNTLEGDGEEAAEAEGEEGNAKIRMADDGRAADKNAPKNLEAFKNGNGIGLNGLTGGVPKQRTIGAPGGTAGNGTGGMSLGTGSGKPKIKNKPMSLGQEIMNLPTIRGLGRVRARYLNKNTAKKAGKMAAMGLGAGVFGTIGIGAGLASDDYSNVFKMGAAGAAGGALLANEATKQAGALIGEGKAVKEAFQKGYYGDEYNDKILNPKLDKEWYNSEQTKRALITKYGDNWQEKREEALELRKLGITNQEDIEKAIKLKDEKGFSLEEAGNIINFANKVTSRGEILSEGGEEELYNQILKMVGDEEAAKRAMQGIKSTLNLEGNTNIREQPKQREITPEMVNNLITTEEHKKEFGEGNKEESKENEKTEEKKNRHEITEDYSKNEYTKDRSKEEENKMRETSENQEGSIRQSRNNPLT